VGGKNGGEKCIIFPKRDTVKRGVKSKSTRCLFSIGQKRKETRLIPVKSAGYKRRDNNQTWKVLNRVLERTRGKKTPVKPGGNREYSRNIRVDRFKWKRGGRKTVHSEEGGQILQGRN